MNRRFIRYLLVGTMSAGLVAPAHAIDFKWFHSLSNNSRNALYVASAAVVAGLSFLAYRMCCKKTVQIPKAAVQPEPAQASAPENKIEMADAYVQTDLGLGQIHTLENEKNALAVRVQDLETQKESEMKQQACREQDAADEFVRALNDKDVPRVFNALSKENPNYEELSPVSRALLMAWPDSMRKLVIGQLEPLKKHIAARKKIDEEARTVPIDWDKVNGAHEHEQEKEQQRHAQVKKQRRVRPAIQVRVKKVIQTEADQKAQADLDAAFNEFNKNKARHKSNGKTIAKAS
ncbi:MAG: hypothetical protein ACHQVS_04015 [Candidatus Babeliales bacterium]